MVMIKLGIVKGKGTQGKSSESVQCVMLKACEACADMGQLVHCTDSEDSPVLKAESKIRSQSQSPGS